MPRLTEQLIYLDNCVPRPLKREFIGYKVNHARDLNWGKLLDDELLVAVAKDFDVMITTDQNMRHQQNLELYDVAIIVLCGRTNRIEDLIPLIPTALNKLQSISSGELIEVHRR